MEQNPTWMFSTLKDLFSIFYPFQLRQCLNQSQIANETPRPSSHGLKPRSAKNKNRS